MLFAISDKYSEISVLLIVSITSNKKYFVHNNIMYNDIMNEI